MTPQLDPNERMKLFIELVNEAEKKTGYRMVAVAQTERLGDAILTRPTLTVMQIPGWKYDQRETEKIGIPTP